MSAVGKNFISGFDQSIQPFVQEVSKERVTQMLSDYSELLPSGWSCLKGVIPDKKAKNELETVASNIHQYVVQNRSCEFLSHVEVRLRTPLNRRKIRLLFVKDMKKTVTDIYFYLNKNWGTIFAEGGQKEFSKGCRIALQEKQVMVTANGIDIDGGKYAEAERTSYHALRGIEGVAHCFHIFQIPSWKSESMRQVYLMRHYAEGDLETVLLREKLSLEKKYSIAWKLALAIESIHAKKISHNDVKLTNVLMDTNFNPVFTDLGLSTELGIRSIRCFGSVGYMPSQICPAELSRDFRKIDLQVAKLHLQIRSIHRDSIEEKSYQQQKDLEQEKKLQVILAKAYQNIFLKSKKVALITGKNDLCAFGYLLEELFGNDSDDAMKKIIEALTVTDPYSRMPIAEASAELEKLYLAQMQTS
jgi:serine/threonine protein kinase